MNETPNVVDEIRAECARRAEAASRMRIGSARACEFAYVCGLREAAELLERRWMNSAR